jgi:membrane-bound metal-dependent hydrolase YbcI (DUF457 family)
MPEPLIHFIIPLFLLATSGIPMKKVVFISSLAILPDLDILFHIHRSFSHSIFFILLFAVPAIMIAKKFYLSRFRDTMIATLVILSHPFMDAFTYFTPVFWPLFNKSVYIITELATNMNNVTDLNLKFNVYFKPVIFYQTQDIDTPIFSSIGVAVTLVLLTGMVLKYYFVKPPSTPP